MFIQQNILTPPPPPPERGNVTEATLKNNINHLAMIMKRIHNELPLAVLHLQIITSSSLG